MSIQTITPGMAAALGLTKDYGVIVSDVWPGVPALAAGLAVGDILVSVDNQPAENVPTVSYNFRIRDSLDNVQLAVLRGQAILSISIKPVETRSDLIPWRRWPIRRRTSWPSSGSSAWKSIHA